MEQLDPPGTTSVNSIIQTGGSFPSSTAVIQMGSGTAQSGVVVKGITVDCLNVIGCVGILNNASQEGSRVEDVTINNAPGIGLHVTADCSSGCVGAANSGPYRNITIQYTASGCGHCTGTTVGLEVDGYTGGKMVRGFDNITVSGNNAGVGSSSTGILVATAATHITNSHVEYFGNGVYVGGPPGTVTAGVQIESVTIGQNQGGWDVTLAGTSRDIVLENIITESTSTQQIYDAVTGNQITSDDFVALYALGHCAMPQNCAVYTTSASVASTAPASFNIVGTISKGGGTFKIDHPLDPAKKYLYHSFVESPDMMNIYNGTVTTNGHGNAVVQLPEYFEALNQDFRYQLTVLGQFAQAIVSQRISGNRFAIKTSKPKVDVSWQVTGVRHDTWANAHRFEVEEDKPPRERGTYLYPDLYKAAETRTMDHSKAPN